MHDFWSWGKSWKISAEKSSVQFITLLKQNVFRGCRLAWTAQPETVLDLSVVIISEPVVNSRAAIVKLRGRGDTLSRLLYQKSHKGPVMPSRRIGWDLLFYACLGREYIVISTCQAGAATSVVGPATGRAACRQQDEQTWQRPSGAGVRLAHGSETHLPGAAEDGCSVWPAVCQVGSLALLSLMLRAVLFRSLLHVYRYNPSY